MATGVTSPDGNVTCQGNPAIAQQGNIILHVKTRENDQMTTSAAALTALTSPLVIVHGNLAEYYPACDML